MLKDGLKAAFCLVVLALIAPAEAGADEWSSIRASGVGYGPGPYMGTARGGLMAERAAKVIATRNLVGAAAQLPYPASFTAYVRGVKVVRTRPAPGGGVEAVVEMTLPTVYIREWYQEW